jgi:type II secretory pathway predicted ATPase ExeA
LLWVSVVAKAADDAVNSNDHTEALKAINWFKNDSANFRQVCGLADSNDHTEALKAINWFKNDSANFRQVCGLAGRDPRYVRKKILPKVLEREKEINCFIKNIRYDNIVPIVSAKQ